MSSVSAWSTAAAVRGTTARAIHESPVISAEIDDEVLDFSAVFPVDTEFLPFSGKVEGKGGVFPGIISKVDTVGSGKTYALKGMAVVTAGRIVGFQEGIIDMTGPGADYTPFSKTLNLVMVCEPVEGIKQHEYEKAVRFAGFRVAAYIKKKARELTPDETKVYETCGIKEGITQ